MRCVRITLCLLAAFGGLSIATRAEGHVQEPVKPCASLVSLAIDNTTIASAKEIADGEPIGQFGPIPIPPQPSHCVVEGKINKHMGADGVEYGDRFQLRLPDAWTGRFLYQGGGGLDGILNPAVGPVRPGFQTALARGYAVVSTDAGHQGKNTLDGAFGSDPEARADYLYRSTKLVAEVAEKIIAKYYGRKSAHAYMAGCSTGGRESMLATQRYPELFDGVVAGDPAFNVVHAAIAEAWFSRKFADIAPKDAQGKPQLQKAFSDADLKLLAGAVLQKCDGLDGLKDGMIDHPDACRFDPAVLQCKADKNDTCLSAAQVNALHITFAGPTDSKGTALYSDWPYDAGLETPGWRMWTLGNDQMPALNVLIYPEFLSRVAMNPGETPIPDAFSFDFDKDPARIAGTAPLMDADSTDLSAFRRHGGKLILYTGMSDPVFSANDLIRYYNRLAQQNGGMAATRQFARLFRIPGMTHCFGGPALDDFDDLTAIETWVERGTPPDQLVATGRDFPGRSRPLCPYPQIPRYMGTGSTEDAANFACKNLQNSPGSNK